MGTGQHHEHPKKILRCLKKEKEPSGIGHDLLKYIPCYIIKSNWDLILLIYYWDQLQLIGDIHCTAFLKEIKNGVHAYNN